MSMLDISCYDLQNLEDNLIDYMQENLQEKLKKNEHQMYIAGLIESINIVKEFFK